MAPARSALREMMNRCEQLADEVDAGTRPIRSCSPARSRSCASRSTTHNKFEEQLLRPVLRELDCVRRRCASTAWSRTTSSEHRSLALARLGSDRRAARRAIARPARSTSRAEERYFSSRSADDHGLCSGSQLHRLGPCSWQHVTCQRSGGGVTPRARSHAEGLRGARLRAIRVRARCAGTRSCEGPAPMSNETIRYDDAIVRKFVTATFVWGVVGMLVGLWCALQLAMPRLNFAPYFTFGRLRPLHTNAVIFAFAGNAIFAAVYYSTQRLLQGADVAPTCCRRSTSGAGRRSSSPPRSRCRSGFTQAQGVRRARVADRHRDRRRVGRLRGQLLRRRSRNRRERHLYVALWFYIATIVTVAILHIFNNLVDPGRRCSRATRSTPACRTRSCSGGTATTRSRSS